MLEHFTSFIRNKKMKKKNLPKQVSYVTILETFRNEQDHRRLYYKCQCVCGKIITRRSDYLYYAYIENRTVSCGCLHPNKFTGSKSNGWEGYGQVSGHYIASLKTRAKNKHLEFNITPQYAWEVFQKQNGKCAISGIPLQLAESRRSNQTMTASIDRIDNSKGYVEGNIQWVYIKINYMRHSLSMEEFLELCSTVHNYNS